MSVRKLRIELTDRARRDLRDIVAYSLDHWGAEQAIAYERAITDALDRLIENPLLGKNRDDLRPGLRGLLIERHLILYRLRDEVIVVQRIIHNRQSAERAII